MTDQRDLSADEQRSPPESSLPPAGAGDVAWAMAEIAADIPQVSALQLKRLLSHSLTIPSPSELREARLGLLIDLVSDGTGAVPTTEDYERARQQRRRRGEEWPAHSTLIRAWGGHWLAVVRAAMRVAFKGNEGRVSNSGHHHKFSTSYSRNEVATAICDCWLALDLDSEGSGPAFKEYLAWAQLCRRQARLAGKPEPRLPTRESVLKAWGTWNRAVGAARCYQTNRQDDLGSSETSHA
jgi:hypothetical protein